MQPAIYLRLVHYQEMLHHVQSCAPEEACGLVGGLQNYSQKIYPVTNQLHSPNRFYMEPEELLKALENIDSQAWELMAVFHSHPTGINYPSQTDLAEYTYPEALMLIWTTSAISGDHQAWECKAYRVENDGFATIQIQIV